MKQLVPAIVAALCIALGSVSAFFLKGSPSAPAAGAAAHAEADTHGDDSHGAKTDSHGEAKSSGGHGGGGHGSSAVPGEVTYYKFSREFVVPMIEDDKVKSLVILNLNLEIDPDAWQKLADKEPVLRDNIMTTLIKLSSGGRTLYSITEVESYETVRTMILANLRSEVSEGIHNVLILDMARQDL